MKENKNKYMIMYMAASLLLPGCASHRLPEDRIGVEACELTPDTARQADVHFRFRIPEGYLGKRARLVITPQFIEDGEVTEVYEPLVVDAPIYAKKAERVAVLERQEDPYVGYAVLASRAGQAMELPYDRTLLFPEGTEGGRLEAVVSTDGCAACSAIDTLPLAVVNRPMPRDTFSLVWMKPVFTDKPKVMQGSGSAALRFAINRAEIDLGLGRNREELEAMARTLEPVLADPLASIRSLEITGLASADGSLPFNATLAHNRALAAKQYIAARFGLDEPTRALITAASRPEGWEPVLRAMREADDPGAPLVADILARYADGGDDVQEQHIRRLACWGRIKDRFLQADRKVEYRYTYVLKSFTTDRELLAMYAERPDAFSEEEFLKVAELMPTAEEKIAVYKRLLDYFPASEIGRNNLSVLEHALRTGCPVKAVSGEAEGTVAPTRKETKLRKGGAR